MRLHFWRRPMVFVMSLSWLVLSPVANSAEAQRPVESRPSTWAEFVEPDFPFFSSVLDARELGGGWPTNNLTPRGLILNLGHAAWACFDLDLLRMAVIWEGAGVTPVSMAQGSYHRAGFKAPEGQEKLPQIIGVPWIANGTYPGWQSGERPVLADPREPGPDPREVGRGPLPATLGRFKAIRLTQRGVRLEYEAGGASVREWVESEMVEGQRAVRRRFRLEGVREPLWLVLGQPASNATQRLQTRLLVSESARRHVEMSDASDLSDLSDGFAKVRVAPSARPIEFSVELRGNDTLRSDSPSPRGTSAERVGERGNPKKQRSSPRPSPPPTSEEREKNTRRAAADPPGLRWAPPITTQATLSTAKGAYVVDDISLPLDNLGRRNVRLADIAFFRDGHAAAVTFDGDVWMIKGLSGKLDRVRWQRFAAGLHEPLSLCVRDGELFVFDRNGIWRLRDTDGNGEADVHELFANAFTQTAETREFANSMKLAPDGSFVIAKGGQQSTTLGKHNGSVLRVSPDGQMVTVLGHGLRQPFLGVHPKTGMVTASDQQGHYVPATPLQIIRDDQFYGFLTSLQPKEQYPARIAEPLTWLPHSVNASGASQVWLNRARMGSLNDALIYFGYNRPEIFLVRLNSRSLPRSRSAGWQPALGVGDPQSRSQTGAPSEGVRGPLALQAAVVSLTTDLNFAPLNGAVNPGDGQLYVTGFQIWGTTAKRTSGLARVRYTGAPSTLPREVVPMDKGILLRFDVALDARQATDVANFSAERWNYRRTANYGSPHFKLDGSPGQEWLPPSSAYLSRDGKSVFVGIPNLKPVMQMRLGWTLATRAGAGFEQNAYFTPKKLPKFEAAANGFDLVAVDLAPRAGRASVTPVTLEEGRRLADLMGCTACHSTEANTEGKVGPTWRGLFGRQRDFKNGEPAVADEAYLRESILEPAAKVVLGFEKNDTGMPSYAGVLSEAQIQALILYLKSLF